MRDWGAEVGGVLSGGAPDEGWATAWHFSSASLPLSPPSPAASRG